MSVRSTEDMSMGYCMLLSGITPLLYYSPISFSRKRNHDEFSITWNRKSFGLNNDQKVTENSIVRSFEQDCIFIFMKISQELSNQVKIILDDNLEEFIGSRKYSIEEYAIDLYSKYKDHDFKLTAMLNEYYSSLGLQLPQSIFTEGFSDGRLFNSILK
jgi:hypothetical protein